MVGHSPPMCLHVLCLSYRRPTIFSFYPFSLNKINGVFLSTFFCFSCASFLLLCLIIHPSEELLFQGRIMHTHNSLKRQFFKKWITSLQICSSSKENMNFLERKKAIKLSADLAMASTRNSKRSWSRALISKASKDRETGNLAKQILGDKATHKCLSQDDINATTFTTTTTTTNPKSRTICVRNNNKPTSSRKIHKLRKIDPKKCGVSSRNKVKKARAMAKKLVEKRTQILKGLVPGGEYMDEYSLVKETLDYVVSLRAQVDVMQFLANSPQLFIHI